MSAADQSHKLELTLGLHFFLHTHTHTQRHAGTRVYTHTCTRVHTCTHTSPISAVCPHLLSSSVSFARCPICINHENKSTGTESKSRNPWGGGQGGCMSCRGSGRWPGSGPLDCHRQAAFVAALCALPSLSCPPLESCWRGLRPLFLSGLGLI